MKYIGSFMSKMLWLGTANVCGSACRTKGSSSSADTDGEMVAAHKARRHPCSRREKRWRASLFAGRGIRRIVILQIQRAANSKREAVWVIGPIHYSSK